MPPPTETLLDRQMQLDTTKQTGTGKLAVVLGAGIVGISTALCLQRDGYQVTLVDPSSPAQETSFGNAGMIATHMIQPVAIASILPRIPMMLLDELAPLTIRWRYLPTVIPWLVQLVLATRSKEVERISAALADELKHAEAAYGPLLENSGAREIFKKKGVLVVYPDKSYIRENQNLLDLQSRNGVVYRIVEKDELGQTIPDLSKDYVVGVKYTKSGHVTDPYKFALTLYNWFIKLGGRFKQASASGFETRGSFVTAVRTNDGLEYADLFVVCAGIWSKDLAAKLGARVPLETERGYHVTLPASGIDLPTAMTIGDRRFAVTPMSVGLRLAGTIEFAGLEAAPNPKRFDALLDNARHAFPTLRADDETRWMGHRPSLPDSMPVVDRAPKYGNAYFNFGHGHLGLTSAAVTGQAVADLAANRQPQFDLKPFRSTRF